MKVTLQYIQENIKALEDANLPVPEYLRTVTQEDLDSYHKPPGRSVGSKDKTKRTPRVPGKFTLGRPKGSLSGPRQANTNRLQIMEPILYLSVHQNLSYGQCAIKLNCSRQYVHKIRNEFEKWFKEYFGSSR